MTLLDFHGISKSPNSFQPLVSARVWGPSPTSATCSGLAAMAPRSFASNPKKEKEKSGEQALDSWFADIVADVDAQEYQPDLVPDHLPDIAGLCQASQAEIEAPAFFLFSAFIRISLVFIRNQCFDLFVGPPDLFVGPSYLFVGAGSGPSPDHGRALPDIHL